MDGGGTEIYGERLMDLIFIDFETFYDRKNKYDLKSLSMTEYIRHTKFKVWGMGYMEDGEADFLDPEETEYFLSNSVDWSNTAVVAHNVKFDGAILAWRYRS